MTEEKSSPQKDSPQIEKLLNEIDDRIVRINALLGMLYSSIQPVLNPKVSARGEEGVYVEEKMSPMAERLDKTLNLLGLTADRISDLIERLEI